jgi:hypothetical protein
MLKHKTNTTPFLPPKTPYLLIAGFRKGRKFPLDLTKPIHPFILLDMALRLFLYLGIQGRCLFNKEGDLPTGREETLGITPASTPNMH